MSVKTTKSDCIKHSAFARMQQKLSKSNQIKISIPLANFSAELPYVAKYVTFAIVSWSSLCDKTDSLSPGFDRSAPFNRVRCNGRI